MIRLWSNRVTKNSISEIKNQAYMIYGLYELALFNFCDRMSY